ncbi:RNA polymerase sigma factor SigJ [Metabacillus fastidiosus]|uniref:RNA polymerase sigma factor SigJ n=1 Tax=Metabacillus fastidiosus TaxID=1458 RepID=UPI002DBB984B|nr:RNA polymerase sigma factor SigJ [Metabacillus fastidiosus]MEC2075776.1 RNA polymerase sigma factor SigJ [Metabacillus fastidiosus]
MEKIQLESLYMQYKGLLFNLAYKLLGNVSDSEDIVHDVYIQLMNMEVHHKNIKSLLCTIVTHRSIDLLKSARYKRETYTGTWLPEPIVLQDSDPLHELISKENMSIAYMYILENLSLTERVVFVLREVIVMEYAAIAEIIGKENAACRKIYSRAKQKIRQDQSGAELTESKEQNRIVDSFMKSLNDGDFDTVLKLLSAEAVYYADGGGIIKAAIRPIETGEKICKLIQGLFNKYAQIDKEVKMIKANVNGEPGIIIYKGEKVLSVLSFQVQNHRINMIYNIVNPNKLKHISIY